TINRQLQEEEKRCLLKWGSSFQLLYGIRRLLVLTSTESMFVSSESSSDGDRTPLSVDLCLFLLSLYYRDDDVDRCLDKFRSEYCTDASAPTLVSDEPFDSHDVDDSPKEKRVRTNCDPAPSN
ncbi:hypothetical protein WA588_005046, partial [Blastocystis sp. NMH]